MGLQSAMTTALTGLQAAETSIDVIGNNIANSNTVGFKSSDVIFATQFLQTQSIGSAPAANSGGTNPRQIGLGVKVSSIGPDFSQGTIEISANPLDLAIQGDGFLVVQGSQGEQLFTRNGQLSLNSLNEVVTSTGNRLLGYGVNEQFELQTASIQPVTIPLGAERVAQPTSTATFQGVLNPEVNAAAVPGQVTSEILGDSSIEFPAGTATDPFDNADVQIQAAPSPGTAAAFDTGAPTGLAVGTYNYRITYVDAAGNESSASTDFTATTTSVNERIDLSGLPTDGASTWDSINIYRTDETGTGGFTLIQNQSINPVGTGTFSDSVAAGTTPLVEDSMDSGVYTYYVTFYNSSTGTETRPSQALGTYSVNDETSSVRFNFDDVETPSDPQLNLMRIYRNEDGDLSTFYLVGDTPAPGQSGYLNSFIDKTSNADLVAGTPDTLDFDGPRAGTQTLLVDVQTRNGTSTYTNPFDLGTATTGTLSFQGEMGGSTLDTLEFDISTSTTVQDLLEFMNDALGLQQSSNVTDIPLPSGGGAITVSDGQIVITSNFGEENEIAIPLTAFRITPDGASAPSPIDISFSETQLADGPGTTSEFLVYDSLGSPLTVRLTTVLESKDSNSTTYRWYASSGDSGPTPPEQTTVVGNGVMIFDNQGDLISSPSARISIQRELSAAESPLEVDLDFTSVTSLAETDATGNPTSSFSMTSQDGFPPGVLTDFIITESGDILGQFSNGTQRTLGQVVMARFANSQGLRQIGDSLFQASVNSGEALFGDPGADGLGSITAGAVELSNTDIGDDLVEMILAQTQYQAGSRVITAAQELLDELLALQR